MFSPTFDLVFSLLLLALAVVFWLGKGDGVLELFRSRSQPGKKRTPEQKRAYQKAIAYFLLPIAVIELISAFNQSAIMGLVLAGVTLVDLLVFAKLTKDM